MNKKIAPLCYLTPIGFSIAALLYSAGTEKTALDRFHLRQSFGLYLVGLFFYVLFKLHGSDLFYFEIHSIIVFIPLLIFWFLGFKWATEGKQKAYPVIGPLFQRWFRFV
jgi:hypothetical protein